MSRLYVAWALPLFFLTSFAFGGATFKADSIPLEAPVNEAYDLDMRTLLSDQGSGNLNWSVLGGGKPGWLTVDSGAGRMVGNPSLSDMGTSEFRLAVQDGDSGSITMIQMKVIAPPSWTQSPIDLGTAKEDAFFGLDLKTKVSNPAGKALSFSASNLPEWLELSASGLLTGTPRRADVGSITGVQITVSNSDGSRVSDAFGVVEKTIHPPFWTQDPIALSNAFEDSAYSENVSNFVDNFEQTQLSYSVEVGPAWLSIDNSGSLGGTPTKPDIGPVQATLKLSATIDGQAFTDTTIVNFEVIHVNHAPFWTQSPIQLPNAPERQAYNQSVRDFSADIDDGDTLSFSKVSGPDWVTVHPNGGISGTPSRPDVGPNSLVVRVSDQDGLFSDNTVNITVDYVNQSPFWTESPITLPDGNEREAYNQSFASVATDPDSGDTLTFSKVSGPAWATIGTDGTISGTPQRANLGLNEFIVRVSDQVGATANVTVKMTVNYVNQDPYWTQNPIVLPEAPERAAYSQSIAQFAGDDDAGDSLSFSKVSGPGWASVSAQGMITGTPQRTHLGLNEFEVKVEDQTGASSVVRVQVTVIYVNQSPYWVQNPINLPNAQERSPYDQSLLSFARDDDSGDTLSFTKISGPGWATVNVNGQITGTPLRANLGLNEFVVRVSDQVGATADVNVRITVDYVNQDPYWTQNPVVLPNAQERSAYSVSITEYANDDDAGDTLSYAKVSGPAWIFVAPNGTIAGTPQRENLGLNEVEVRVSDQTGASSTTTFQITVDYVNQVPYWVENPVILPNARERESYSQNLSEFARDDDDGDRLSFSKVSGPAWAQVQADGTIAGTPAREDLGLNEFVVGVADQTGASANVTVRITVDYVNQSPFWTENPITLPNANERSSYSQSVAALANDPDSGDSLSFSKVSGPAWATMNANGTVSGTPQREHLGLNEFVIRVSDQVGATADVTVRITVDYVNQDPFWTSNPITLPDAREREAYSQSLAEFAKDNDTGDTLSFNKVSGPAWASLSAEGLVTGTPARTDLGINTFDVRVQDQTGASANVTVRITVRYVNQSPLWAENPITLPNADERSAYSESVATFASDPDSGDSLRFSKVSGPAWASVNANGTVSGTPQRENLGLNEFVVRVSDQVGATADVTVRITVDYVNQDPYWVQNPITLPNALEREAYNQNVAEFASDNDSGDTLSFSKISGPAWAQVQGDGTIAGTPARVDLGLNEFVLSVTDQTGASANVTVRITVDYVNQAPVWSQSPIRMPDAFERTVYDQSVQSFATDPDSGDILSFSKIGGPDWLLVGVNGELGGTPARGDVGENSFELRVTDHRGLSSDVSVLVKVNYVNNEPAWTQNPIRLPNAETWAAYSQQLRDFATDIDGDTLSYRLINGPEWVTVATTGEFFGTPDRPDIGENSWTVEVSDGQAAVQTTILVKVVKANEPPVWTNNPTILPDAQEDFVYRQNLSTFATDPDGDVLSFEIVEGPEWVSLDGAALTGVPAAGDLGLNVLKIRVTDNISGEQVADVHITVVHTNHNPYWTQNPIRLPNAREREDYRQSLAEFAKDDDFGDILAYEKVSGPEWMSVSIDGVVFGTPARNDVGQNSFEVRVLDDKGGSAVVTVQIEVEYVNQAPLWTQNPFVMPNARERESYYESAKAFASDPDGDALVFEKVSGPAWASIGPDGDVFGTPKRADLGLNEFVVRVKDPSGLFADGTMQITVDYVNQKPIWSVNPIPLGDATEDAPYRFDLTQFVSDADGEALSFKLIEGPAWLILSSDGILTGIPRKPDVGSFTAKFEASDGTDEVTVDGFGRVIAINHAPYWTQNPLQLPNAQERSPYAESLAEFAVDIDGDALNFTKLSGPDWASISTGGMITGTPQREDLGTNVFSVRVADPSGLSADVVVNIEVEFVNTPPRWTQSPILLDDAFEETLYLENVAPFATDADGDSLSFGKVSGPAWLSVGVDGVLTGTPANGDIGDFTLVVEVSDGQAQARVEAKGRVRPINHPPVLSQDPIRITLKERETVTEDLKQYASDPDGDTLVFELISSADWVSLSPAGMLRLTPKFKDIGTHSFRFRVHDGDLQTQGNLEIKVLRDARPPQWLEDPIRYTTKINVPFSESLTEKVTDLDGIELTFSKVSGPAWLNVGEFGTLNGTPLENDLGENTFAIEARNDVLGAVATVIVTVRPDNVPPVWSEDPLRLADALEDSSYAFDLKPLVTDEDGDALILSIIDGPAWLTINDGVLGGTPTKPDVGDFTAVFAAYDGKYTVEVGAVGRVWPVNHPPAVNQDNLHFVVKAREELSEDLTDPKFVTDLDGDNLNFAITENLDWFSLSQGGLLVLRPMSKDVGEYVLDFVVGDGEFEVPAKIYVTVLKNPLPPVWSEDPIRFEARVNKLFGESLANKVSDPEGRPLQFSKVNGPTWLSVNSDTGEISGTPLIADFGMNTFEVLASNADLGASVTVLINVTKGGDQVDNITIDEAVPGAKAENLWVVENSKYSYYVQNALKRSIPVFFDALSVAQVHHTAMMISTDPQAGFGKPIVTDDRLIRWNDSSLISDFRRRVDKAYSQTCVNSPIWSMNLFYDLLPSLAEVPTQYFLPSVPMDAMIATQQLDHFPWYQENTEHAGWGTEQYADHFIDIHDVVEKPYRISAIAPKCPKLSSPYSKSTTAPSNAYQRMVDATGGKYYEVSQCPNELDDELRDFAKDVIFRAYVSAKQYISLTKTVDMAYPIEVFLGGVLLPGNTGEESDLWRYLAESNQIEVYWNRIGFENLKPGQGLEIKYRYP